MALNKERNAGPMKETACARVCACVLALELCARKRASIGPSCLRLHAPVCPRTMPAAPLPRPAALPLHFPLACQQEQCQKLRDEREAAMRDLARLRCDCEAANGERERLAAELKEVKEELDK